CCPDHRHIGDARVIPMTPAEVAVATGGRTAGPVDGRPITGAVVTDSRHVVPGCIFAALVGEHVDGHDFAAAAVEAGAALVLAERELGGADAPLPVVVVPDVTTALGDLARSVLARLRAD